MDTTLSFPRFGSLGRTKRVVEQMYQWALVARRWWRGRWLHREQCGLAGEGGEGLGAECERDVAGLGSSRNTLCGEVKTSAACLGNYVVAREQRLGLRIVPIHSGPSAYQVACAGVSRPSAQWPPEWVGYPHWQTRKWKQEWLGLFTQSHTALRLWPEHCRVPTLLLCCDLCRIHWSHHHNENTQRRLLYIYERKHLIG